MGRISNAIGLAKASWEVLRKDRGLRVFPLLSFLVSVLVLAVLAADTDVDRPSDYAGEASEVPSIVPVVGVPSALARGMVSASFTGALVAGAHERATDARRSGG
ncbi:MAG: hypothetical protein QGI28_05600 [Acidimicrobiales bacterium]|nr:hypothetical protein [Acidimicrobiales bacterium]MDP6760534.1 hypothetical protein [Acidimicrobiales bacterium]